MAKWFYFYLGLVIIKQILCYLGPVFLFNTFQYNSFIISMFYYVLLCFIP